MSIIKLFTLAPGSAVEIPSSIVPLEKNLQQLFEDNMQALLGVSFVAHEHTTAEGRIDTLGIDERNRAVIVEYKRRTNENVITQGLAYRAWVKRNRDNLKWVVSEALGRRAANQLDCSAPRLICVAAEFNKNDKQSADDIDVDIELIQYRIFGKDTLLLEHLNAQASTPHLQRARINPKPSIAPEQKVAQPKNKGPGSVSNDVYSIYLAKADGETKRRFEKLASFLESLGDDVVPVTKKQYLAFRRNKKGFASLLPRVSILKTYVHLDQSKIVFDGAFLRDVTNVGHNGIGHTEITIVSDSDMERAKPLLRRAYEEA